MSVAWSNDIAEAKWLCHDRISAGVYFSGEDSDMNVQGT